MLTFLIFLSIFGLISATSQSVAATGTVLCNGKPVSDLRVKLYDKDAWTTDDKLAEVKTDNNGQFKISGTGQSDRKMMSKFNIYHRCGMGMKICWYKNSFDIPSTYVVNGGSNGKVYDAGRIELSQLTKDRDCFN
ncbi:unnamed protein product, partial [Mesorhabditis spiculigera]